MPRIKFNSEIIQGSTGFKDMTDKIAGSGPALIFDGTHVFDTAGSMFYPYSKRSGLPVILYSSSPVRHLPSGFLQAVQSQRLQG